MHAVDPPKAVTVRQSDGTWPGWLSAWRRTNAGWRAYVAYRRGPGMTYVHWVVAGDVALACGPDTSPTCLRRREHRSAPRSLP